MTSNYSAWLCNDHFVMPKYHCCVNNAAVTADELNDQSGKGERLCTSHVWDVCWTWCVLRGYLNSQHIITIQIAMLI